MKHHRSGVRQMLSGYRFSPIPWSPLLVVAALLLFGHWAPSLAAEPSARLAAVRGTVALVRADGSGVQPVSVNAVIGPGDRLATVGGASTTVEIAGIGQAELGANTTIVVRELQADGGGIAVVVEVVSGITIHRLTAGLPPGRYRVVDPSGQAAAEALGPATFGVARDENGNVTVACSRCPSGSLSFPNGTSTVLSGWTSTLTARGDLISGKLGGNLFDALADGASAGSTGSRTAEGNRLPPGQATGSNDRRGGSDEDDETPATHTGATIIRVLPTVQATIANFVFLPDPIVVQAGQSIRWTNLDVADHTVTADDHAFTSPVLFQGDTYTLTLMQPGTYGYFCEPHPQMTGSIVVQ